MVPLPTSPLEDLDIKSRGDAKKNSTPTQAPDHLSSTCALPCLPSDISTANRTKTPEGNATKSSPTPDAHPLKLTPNGAVLPRTPCAPPHRHPLPLCPLPHPAPSRAPARAQTAFPAALCRTNRPIDFTCIYIDAREAREGTAVA